MAGREPVTSLKYRCSACGSRSVHPHLFLDRCRPLPAKAMITGAASQDLQAPLARAARSQSIRAVRERNAGTTRIKPPPVFHGMPGVGRRDLRETSAPAISRGMPYGPMSLGLIRTTRIADPHPFHRWASKSAMLLPAFPRHCPALGDDKPRKSRLHPHLSNGRADRFEKRPERPYFQEPNISFSQPLSHSSRRGSSSG